MYCAWIKYVHTISFRACTTNSNGVWKWFDFTYILVSSFHSVVFVSLLCSIVFVHFLSSLLLCTFAHFVCDSSNKSSLNSQFVVVVLVAMPNDGSNTRDTGLCLGDFHHFAADGPGWGSQIGVCEKRANIQFDTHNAHRFKSLAAKAFTLSAGDTKHISTIKRNSLCRPSAVFFAVGFVVVAFISNDNFAQAISIRKITLYRSSSTISHNRKSE